jgi:hypothetical protein
VIDADTGKMKRFWGAYGNKPDDANLGPYDPTQPPAQQFRNPSTVSNGRTTAWSMSATAPTTGSRSSRPKASS